VNKAAVQKQIHLLLPCGSKDQRNFQFCDECLSMLCSDGAFFRPPSQELRRTAKRDRFLANFENI
jgi:hypothetical protein